MSQDPTLVYIHGATATSISFSYIRNYFFHKEILLDYDCSRGFYHNLESMRQQLEGIDNLFFIGHSLGGIYALHLANHFKDQTVGGVTLSTPYGGSKEAVYLGFLFPFNKLLQEITPYAAPIRDLKKLTKPRVWTNVVTKKENSLWWSEPNDGVVTQASMRCYSNMELIDLDVNHYEVVVSPITIDIISERIKKAPVTE